MKTFTPEFNAYAASQLRTPEDQLAFDTKQYPGGKMTGFIIWITGALAAFKKASPKSWEGDRVHDQAAKIEFLKTYSRK